MQTAFKLAYSLVVAILLVLFVILGTRTFYEEPEPPTYPSMKTPPLEGRPILGKELHCDSDQCYLNGQALTQQEEEELLTTGERDYLRQQREFNQRQREYGDDRVDYRRNVFILASALGVAAIAAGLFLFRRVEAMPLGLMLGGLGVVIYGWVEAAEDFDEIGTAPLFAVVAVGLVIVLAGGYRFLGTRGASGDNGGTGSGQG